MSEIDRLLIDFSSAMMGYFNTCRIYVRSIETNQAPLSIAALLEIVCPPRVTQCIGK